MGLETGDPEAVYRVTCPHEQDTFELGERLGAHAGPFTVVALSGDLGAGKTVFAKGVGSGLRVQTLVRSPTFVVVQRHDGGRLPFVHADLYRLGDADELLHLGLDDLLAEGGVAVLEWAERFPEILPEEHLAVEIGFEGNGRLVTLTPKGPVHGRLAQELIG